MKNIFIATAVFSSYWFIFFHSLYFHNNTLKETLQDVYKTIHFQGNDNKQKVCGEHVKQGSCKQTTNEYFLTHYYIVKIYIYAPPY